MRRTGSLYTNQRQDDLIVGALVGADFEMGTIIDKRLMGEAKEVPTIDQHMV